MSGIKACTVAICGNVGLKHSHIECLHRGCNKEILGPGG